jgi:hypothetical protein
MVTIEQIDEFRRRTNSSYEDARFFLERHQGDVLEAIIDFEKAKAASGSQAKSPKKGEFGRRVTEIIQKGFDLRMTVEDKAANMLFTVPILVLLLLTPIWPMILIACLGLIFLGYKLGFKDIRTPTVDVSHIFENLGHQFQDVGRQQGFRAGQQGHGRQDAPQGPDRQDPPQGQTYDAQPRQAPAEAGAPAYGTQGAVAPYAPNPAHAQHPQAQQVMTQPPQQSQRTVQPWQTATSPASSEPLNPGVERPAADGFKEYTVE